ncbi:hypothetical protein AAF712_001057 [Marasmius tenuissimus]|uniref:Eukaryotic translation initiation factor 4E transporter n=1 Tax=Marasmius tenuissimus TaxID=585030 RepID=A0ABR3AFC3_9AGAR
MDTSALEDNSKVNTPTKENESADTEPILSKDSSDHAEQPPTPTKCPKIYTRAQILALYKSPLVALPNGMPELKDWFGSENEQNLNRKESEPSTPNSGRERRFRRDPEDGDLPARPSFRSAASQPSQMGNFKHQSIRSSDRDIDRDGERLRNLSDKFDRDRLSISGLRNKDRDTAPHFAPGSSRGTAQAGTIAARRAETRDGAKKKVGESSEDWRRGGDVRRSDRNVNARDERDSRARDSSRSRRDSSPLRREERNDSRRDRDRDRDDYRRERDELRRERDRDHDGEQEDSKRWREDGKRDERMTPRRDRPRDKPPHENSWENGDRRWASTSEDKDRGKKGAARDRKNPAPEDSGKDREERRLEREKEKEPAWMDTYIPPSSGGGILGGKGVDGELDGIQAWKKNMKEKEQKAQKVSKPASTTQEPSQPLSQPERQEEPMDEIQRFKQLMEAAQKQKSPQTDPNPGHSSASPTNLATETKASDNRKPQESTKDASQPIDPAHSLLSLLTSSNTSLHAASSQPPTSNDPAAKSPLKSTDPSIVGFERPSSNPSSSTALPMNAPQGSRLLALGNKLPINPQTTAPNGSASPSTPQTAHKSALAGSQAESAQTLPNAPSRSSNTFSPFEERDQAEALRRASAERNALSTDPGWSDAPGVDHPGSTQSLGKGSRFAKFFDAKGKEAPPHMPVQKAASPVGGLSSSPIPVQRPDVGFNANSAPNGEHRSVEDLFAKLNMSSQLQPQRSNPPQPGHTPGNISFGQQVHNNLQQQQQLQHHHLSQQQQQLLQSHLHNNSRIESFAESRNFTPDGLVPGLRSAPPPRSRENVGIYQDNLDEVLLLNAQQRLSVQQQQQQRSLDQLYSGSVPAGFGQQGNRNVGLTLQQQQFRGGPSPTLQSQHTPVQQQRLPPGLANLGGRPPHDPTQQLLGLQGALGSQVHSGLHMNPPQQHNFNNFHPQTSNVGFGGPQPQLRGPPPGNALNLPAHHQLGGLGVPGGLDLRNANHQQAQLLAMSGLGGGGLRGVSNNGYNSASSAQLQTPLLAQLRQQQQPPQLPPHMMPHMMPPHLQQQQGPMSGNQSAQDLMALLMGGGHRE